MNLSSFVKLQVILIAIHFTIFAQSIDIEPINKTNSVIEDFQVNENTGTEYPIQNFSNIGSDSLGNFLVVWEDQRNKISNIYYQRYNSEGFPIGKNIGITNITNAKTYYSAQTPSIVVTKNGNFIIAWYEYREYQKALKLQRFFSNGDKLGEEIQIISETPYLRPALTITENKYYFISWIEHFDQENYKIYIQKLGSIDEWIGSKIQLKELSEGTYIAELSISSNDKGQFAIAADIGGNVDAKLLCQMYSKDYTPLTGELHVRDNNNYFSDPDNPHISLSDSGNFIVVWSDSRLTAGPKIYAQLFNANGEKVGNNFQVVNDFGDQLNINPYVKHFKNNDFIISWAGYTGFEIQNIYFQKYSSKGIKTTNTLKINDVIDSTRNNIPSFAISSNEDIVFCWVKEKISSSFNSNIYGKIFYNSSQKFGNEFLINDNDETPYSEQSYPEIAVNMDGDFIITWKDTRNNKDEIFAQIINKNGTFIGSNIKVPLDNPQSYQVFFPKVVCNKNKNFLIVWITNTGQIESINGQIFSQTGAKIGNNILISEILNTWGDDIQLASDLKGNFNIIWRDVLESDNLTSKVFMKQISEIGEIIIDNFEVIDDSVYKSQWSASIAPLSNGNMVITYIGFDGDTINWNPTYTFAQILSPDGNKIGNKIIVDTGGMFTTVASSLESDYFWIGLTNGNYEDFSFNIHKFSINGEHISELSNISEISKDFNYWSNPKISVSANDFILISYYYSYYGENNTFWTALYDNDLNIIGKKFKVVNIGFGHQKLHKSLLYNNNIYSTWVDDRTGDNDDDIWANVLDINNVNNLFSEESSMDIIDKYFLSQNFPNPFNPSTTIKYSIQLNEKREMANVKLVVYDILGRENETLVNQKQKPGNYEVIWNASNQPSGVYFYKLTVGSSTSSAANYVEAKKMILLK